MCRRVLCLLGNRCRRLVILRRVGCSVYSGSLVFARCTYVWFYVVRVVFSFAGDVSFDVYRLVGFFYYICNVSLFGVFR